MDIDLYDFTAIDFETANHHRSSACAVGIVRVEEGIIIDEYYSPIKPDPYFFNPINQKVHGMSEEDVKDAPSFVEVWEEIHHWIKDEIIIGHNVSFEESVISKLFHKHDINWFPEEYLCSMYLSKVRFPKKRHPNLKNYKLPNVYHYLFDKKINHHDPLEDARACAEIAIAVTNDWKPKNFKEMAKAMYVQPNEYFSTKTSTKRLIPSKLVKDVGYENVNFLRGNTFVFSGSPTPYTKTEAAQIVFNFGATVGGDVTKKTTHLVCGNLPENYASDHLTGKAKKAYALKKKGQSIEIITANLFEQLISMWRNKAKTLFDTQLSPSN